MSSIGTKWRNRKAEVKKLHFSEEKTTEEMLANRPKGLPEPQFKDLLISWNTEEAKEESDRNKDNRGKQTDMHNLGPKSLAVLRHEMQENDPAMRCPTQAELYMKSRERTAGRKYLTQNDETLQNIEKMKALMSSNDRSTNRDPYYDVITKEEHSGRLRMFGHGVTKSSLKIKEPKNPFILPQIFLDPISQRFEQKLEEMSKRQEARFEKKISTVISKFIEANRGLDLVIPDLKTTDEDESDSPHD